MFRSQFFVSIFYLFDWELVFGYAREILLLDIGLERFFLSSGELNGLNDCEN
jgi:hypothetical protein